MADRFRQTAGAAWVERYLDPLLRSGFRTPTPHLDCLHIWADDDDEASQLRRKGHRCVVLMPDIASCRQKLWRQPPVVGCFEGRLPFADSTFDLVFTGAFARLARTSRTKTELAQEIARVVRSGGATLLSVSNRYCPVDLQDRRSFLHGPYHPEKSTLTELRRALTDAGFSRVDCLSVQGHFGWGRVPSALRPLAAGFERYLRNVSSPARPWLYASPLNPVLMLWGMR